MGSVVLAGGGSAGHVNPLLATARELVSRGHEVTAVGTAEGLEADLVPRAGIDLRLIPRVPFPRRPNGAALRFPGAFSRATRQARGIIADTRADAVVGFGGYVATPAYKAARLAHVPIVVHEANARPGFANRYGARFAAAVATSFPDTRLRGWEGRRADRTAVVTGLPLREEITDLARALHAPRRRDAVVAEARAAYGWGADARVLLAFGGSLGAASINAAVAAAAPTLVRHGIHIIHLTGAGKAEPALRARDALADAERGAYDVSEYAHDMARALAAASAVVSRSGAGTVSEVTALGLPALYVPLPVGNGEQELNAGGAVRAGAAVVLADNDLTPARLVLEAERMILDPAEAARMREAAAAVAMPDAAARLADLIEAAMR